MSAANTLRPQLKIRRLNLDTGRENVAVISQRSKALRPELFRGFSRIELRRNSKVLLATLLITDDDSLVGPADLGLAEPAFRRFAEVAGRYRPENLIARPLSDTAAHLGHDHAGQDGVDLYALARQLNSAGPGKRYKAAF